MSVQDLVTEVEVALVEGDRLDKEILGPQLEPQFADCWLGLKMVTLTLRKWHFFEVSTF
jgi:hypothetical protein